MQGGVKFYRGSAKAARTYVEADRSRVDDYYLAEGTGVATRYVAASSALAEGGPGVPAGQTGGTLDGDAYERWVAGYDEHGNAKGRLRTDDRGLRFVEVVINGPKTWSLAASLHPKIASAYDTAQERAAVEIIDWLADHATTRVGPRDRQVQVPVEKLEAAVVRHYTSRAGDPHRHLHVQINARVYAAGAWRGLHSVGVVDSIEAINGIGTAAVACDPEFRHTLARHGYTLDRKTGEITQLAPYAGLFSARTRQITRNLDRYEAAWRTEHPGDEPGPTLRQIWDRRAWSDARPDKVFPADGAGLVRRWNQELLDLGFTPPATSSLPGVPPGVPPTSPDGSPRVSPLASTPVGRVKRDAVADLVITRLGAKRSSWNTADLRGQVERIISSLDVVTDPQVRRELAEDLTQRAALRCVPLLSRGDVPEHVRHLTSPAVLAVEDDLITYLTRRAEHPGKPATVGAVVARRVLDPTQQRVAAAIAGTGRLIVIEGAAGAGKTTTLAAAAELVEMHGQRLVCVTPTLKAARVAAQELGADAHSAAWLIHQHGFRWDEDGHRNRLSVHRNEMDAGARLLPGDILLVDEAGMLDQDTAAALLTVASESQIRVALVGDRHQLPAVGRGGVLDLAARWAAPDSVVTLDRVHRFSDPQYADLTLLMRTGERPGEVFDDLVGRGLIKVHASEVERSAHLAQLGGASHSGERNGEQSGEGGQLVIADTREQVALLNAAIRDHRSTAPTGTDTVAVASGELIGVGDRVATRRNDRDLAVANRDTWTVTDITPDGGLRLTGRPGERQLPPAYVDQHVELAYATTVYGAQGETVDTAHLAIGEGTGAAAAYVSMTRGRHRNTAHLVADSLDDARAQWITVFSRDRADLGPGHAAHQAADDIERYGPQPTDTARHRIAAQRAVLRPRAQEVSARRRPEPDAGGRSPDRGGRGIGF